MTEFINYICTFSTKIYKIMPSGIQKISNDFAIVQNKYSVIKNIYKLKCMYLYIIYVYFIIHFNKF